MGDEFPYLTEFERIEFPFESDSPGDAPLAAGGNLSPGMLLSAYEQGVFPWFNPGEDIYWWNPDPRFVLFPQNLHVSRRFSRSLKTLPYEYSLDLAFDQVIGACSAIPREGQEGTWITGDMIDGYRELHRLGYAHSAEVWVPAGKADMTAVEEKAGGELSEVAPFFDGKGRFLAGGLYGISLGSCFFGESMFSLLPGSSKAAFVSLARRFQEAGFSLIDCQMETPHMSALGGEMIARADYMRLLKAGLRRPTLKGSWADIFLK